jgi:alkanesulfonate monooxygenase SsuD/methylene tetrahydromethanopterin reductase-like flavin-dependent oxidoreductase (luciferase family)
MFWSEKITTEHAALRDALEALVKAPTRPDVRAKARAVLADTAAEAIATTKRIAWVERNKNAASALAFNLNPRGDGPLAGILVRKIAEHIRTSE